MCIVSTKDLSKNGTICIFILNRTYVLLYYNLGIVLKFWNTSEIVYGAGLCLCAGGGAGGPEPKPHPGES